MHITDVKISPRRDDKLRAFATVTLDGCFVVRGLKVIHSADRFFVAMPARRRPDGTFQDIAHPIHAHARRMIEERVLAEYEKMVAAGGA
ncbi:MAG: SpoVG family protein [Candidatus Latescibacterota bacterium]|nr:MAG: SpoVG family protein [Candidatus Latescibacterota bacterium]